jgi:protein TonB
MTRKRLFGFPLALLLSLAVNGSGLYLMIQVNLFVHAPTEKAQAAVNTIHIQEQPKKKRRRYVQRRLVQVRPRAVPLPVPDLPSSISSEQLNLAGMGAVDLFGELLGHQQDIDANLIMKEEAVDEPPRVIGRVAPEYPRLAEDRGIEGQVVFKLQVSRAGRVERVWVLKSKPPGVFEAAAEKAVRRYRFSPARFKGQAVPVLCRQRIVFKLED